MTYKAIGKSPISLLLIALLLSLTACKPQGDEKYDHYILEKYIKASEIDGGIYHLSIPVIIRYELNEEELKTFKDRLVSDLRKRYIEPYKDKYEDITLSVAVMKEGQRLNQNFEPYQDPYIFGHGERYVDVPEEASEEGLYRMIMLMGLKGCELSIIARVYDNPHKMQSHVFFTERTNECQKNPA